MRGLRFLALLAAGAAALPHRMGASAVKKVGHVPSRRTAPSLSALDASLSALEADVDKLDHAVPKLERIAVLVGVAIGAAIDAIVNKVAKKAGDTAGAGVRRMFATAEDEDGVVDLTPLMAANNKVAQACMQLRAFELQYEAAKAAAEDAGEEPPVALAWGGINVEAELGALRGDWTISSQDGQRVGYYADGVLTSEPMVTDFETAKGEYVAAKRELMQAYTDAAQTKAGIQFDASEQFTV